MSPTHLFITANRFTIKRCHPPIFSSLQTDSPLREVIHPSFHLFITANRFTIKRGHPPIFSSLQTDSPLREVTLSFSLHLVTVHVFMSVINTTKADPDMRKADPVCPWSTRGRLILFVCDQHEEGWDCMSVINTRKADPVCLLSIRGRLRLYVCDQPLLGTMRNA